MVSTATANHTAGPDEAAALAVRRLEELYADSSAQELVSGLIRKEFPRRIALVSSFGSSAAVLLNMVAQADRRTPVLFLDTGKHFGETLRYRDALVERLGLADMRVLAPEPSSLGGNDPNGILWMKRPDLCCFIRKVEPLQRGLAGFAAYFNGRRREHGAARASLRRFEASDGRVRINPLFDWSESDVDAYFARHRLPRHPLEEDGFKSIGCLPCTDRIAPGESTRAGRWRGKGKTECGIHLPIETFKDFGSGI